MHISFISSLFLMTSMMPGVLPSEDNPEKETKRYAIKAEQSELEDSSYQLHYRFSSPKRHGVVNSFIQYTDPGKFSTNSRNGAWKEEKDGSVEVTVTITMALLPPGDDQPQQRIELKIVQASNLGKAYTSHRIKLKNPIKHLDDVIGDSIEGGWINIDEQVTLLTLNEQPIYFTLETERPEQND